MLTQEQFYNKFGGLLVERTEDDSEFGDHLFLHPEEIDLLEPFKDENHQIVSVYETENGNMVKMAPCEFGEETDKIGYFVISKPNL
jgi:hypothetical protein